MQSVVQGVQGPEEREHSFSGEVGIAGVERQSRMEVGVRVLMGWGDVVLVLVGHNPWL